MGEKSRRSSLTSQIFSFGDGLCAENNAFVLAFRVSSSRRADSFAKVTTKNVTSWPRMAMILAQARAKECLSMPPKFGALNRARCGCGDVSLRASRRHRPCRQPSSVVKLHHYTKMVKHSQQAFTSAKPPSFAVFIAVFSSKNSIFSLYKCSE